MEPAEYALMDAAEAGMWWYRALHARLLDALRDVRGDVLDAGCGTGGLLGRLGGCPGLRGIGLERDMVAARRAAAKSGAMVACGSVNALPFASGRFEAAILSDVLCHREVEPLLALPELRRVLRPGGRLVVNMPAYGWLLSGHDRRVHNSRRQTAREVRAMLAQAGFADVHVHYWNGLLLPLMVVRRKFFHRRNSASDVSRFSPWLNTTLHTVTEIERHLPMPLPAGGSVLATARRP